MKLKKKGLLVNELGISGEIVKAYLDENKEVCVQVLTEKGILFGKLEDFKPKNSLFLRCNNCNKESYEDLLEVDEEKQLYKCECGSSTFTPLNLDEINY